MDKSLEDITSKSTSKITQGKAKALVNSRSARTKKSPEFFLEQFLHAKNKCNSSRNLTD